MFIHVYFTLNLEGMTKLTHNLRCRLNWGVYTVICHATTKSVKTTFIVWISWKKMDIIWKMRLCLLSKDTIYNWKFPMNEISTRAVVKTMLYLMVQVRTELKEPYWKFSCITCTVTPLVNSVNNLGVNGSSQTIESLNHFMLKWYIHIIIHIIIYIFFKYRKLKQKRLN